jgi:hypothetical protein
MLAIATMPLWAKALLGGVDGIDLDINVLPLFVRLVRLLVRARAPAGPASPCLGLRCAGVDALERTGRPSYAAFLRLRVCSPTPQIIVILVPSVIGKAVRDLVPPVQRFVDKWKTPLSMFATFNLAFIVWQALSGSQNIIVNTKFLYTFEAMMLAIAQHVIYLVSRAARPRRAGALDEEPRSPLSRRCALPPQIFNYIVVWWVFKMPIREAIATIIMSSQKSAPVAVTVITFVATSADQQGLMAIPCITGQICQIFIGSALAPLLARQVRSRLWPPGGMPAPPECQAREPRCAHAASSAVRRL